MDLAKMIRELRVERSQVKEAIAALEKASLTPSTIHLPPQRGRGSMGPEERRQVSQRMRLYWAARKQANKTREK